ncbi:MAG: 3-isopropylmalate dehydratase [Acidimicrobiia bacterium]|nr:MAG: 3-isopropylmalate dehydratase [Acidimicrobiia bacterium]
MSENMIRGRVWRFGDDISTDLLSPGQFALDPLEVRMRHVLESINPSFAQDVKPGDVVVAGANFGCGSSRETAAENLKALGVACVAAGSLSRIFMRNAIAVGLPILICPGIGDAFAEGDPIEIDLAAGTATNTATGTTCTGEALPEEMRRILAAGGILEVLRLDGGTRPG